MIRSNNKPTSFSLSITYDNLLSVDTIENLKKGFGMLGMRFVGKPRKAQIVKGYAKYVKEHPKDVLYCLPADNLSILNEILKKGKGSYVTVKGVEVFNQLQKMNLVVTWENQEENTSYLYLIDELYDLFAPHIEEVLNNPVDYLDFNLPDPSELTDEQVDQLLNSAPVQNVLNNIKQKRIAEIEAANKAQEEEGPFNDYLPAFTKIPAKFPPAKDSYCATRLVRPRIYEVTIPYKGDIYFIVYFHWLEQKGYTQATCYWGNIFDFTIKSALEPFLGAGYIELSRPFAKKYPHVASVYGAQDNNKLGERPYLTTIGWDYQPKEWWLSMRLYDLNFADLVMLGPLDCEDVLNAIDDLRDTSLAMMRDIQRSDAKQPKHLMNELFGL